MEQKKTRKKSEIQCCEFCDYTTTRLRDMTLHLLTRKHNTVVYGTNMEIKKLAEEGQVYFCEKCNFTTLNSNDYNRHNLTKKHNANMRNTIEDNIQKHNCLTCNKQFVHASGLWKHKKKCKSVEVEEDTNKELENVFYSSSIELDKDNDEEKNIFFTPELFMEILKQSKELQNELVEQNKELQNKLLDNQNKLLVQNEAHHKEIIEITKNTQSIVHHTNSHNTTNNNQFNLNFFLNETCKDAMNITDFVNSLQLTTSDFENTGRLGYIDGISRIIINGLKDIDVEKRPIHCTDLKRETVYIKHDNTWEKEEPDKKKLKWAVNSIARLNLQQLDKWQEENPEYKVGESTKNYEYLKYCSAALGGQYKEEDDKFAEKIMKNVLKNVVVDKRV
jgi:hypothetical protein